MNRFIWWIVKKLITLMWKREHFFVHSWGVDEYVDIYVITEESYLDKHRFGLREEIYKEQENEEEPGKKREAQAGEEDAPGERKATAAHVDRESEEGRSSSQEGAEKWNRSR